MQIFCKLELGISVSDKYDKLIYEDINKFKQLHLTVSSFKDTDYISIREYFLSYEGQWTPSKIGVSIPANIDSIYAILDGLLEIMSKAEGREIITKYYDQISKQDGEKIPLAE